MSQEGIRTLSPEKRVRTFEEVHLGISKGEAIENAKIFLERERAVKGSPCPLGTDHFDVLRYVAKGDMAGALGKLLTTNPLPGVTGRLACEPFEVTQAYNRKGERISIRAIERFLADTVKPQRGDGARRGKQKIAIIGSGATGLTAASLLARAGHPVTVFEASHILGGRLSYGYGAFRLPRRVVESAVERLKAEGVVFLENTLVGRRVDIVDIVGDLGFSALLLASGAGMSGPLNIPGEGAAGVITADEAMKLVLWMRASDGRYATPSFLGPRVIIVGATEMAFEAARTARRLGKEVVVVAETTESEIKVSSQVVREAFEEGVVLKTLTRPVRIETDALGCVSGLLCHPLDYRVDAAGRLSIIEEAEASFTVAGETVINAALEGPATAVLKDAQGLTFSSEGAAVTAGTSATTLRKVFAAGRVVDPSLSVMDVMLAAKKAVLDIETFIQA